MHRFLLLAVLGLCVSLAGCQELQNSSEKDAAAGPSEEVTARFCSMARIGSLAEMPDDIWEVPDAKEQAFLNDSDVPGLMAVSVSKAVAEEVDPDFLAIVQSAANETTTDEAIRSENQKKDGMDLAIEMVDEKPAETAEKDGKAAASEKNGKSGENKKSVKSGKSAKSAKLANDEAETPDSSQEAPEGEAEAAAGSDEEMEVIHLTGEKPENAESSEETEVESEDEEPVAESSEETPAETSGESDVTGESAKEKAESEAVNQDFARIEEEVDRQAEAVHDLIKNAPEGVRDEIRKANFRNVSFRIMKLPGSFLYGKTTSDYYVIRSMEYVGSDLSRDVRTLSLSPKYSEWMKDLEKYLDIITLDDFHHEYWVEVPEFWNSEEK